MQITWRASQSASCFHAAVALADGHALVDLQLAEAIAMSTALLLDVVEWAGLPPLPTLRKMYALTAAGIESDQLLVERVLSKKAGFGRTSEIAVQRFTGNSSQLTGRVRDLEVAYRNYFAKREGPPLVEELELRSQPLRQQWQAYGPGLLNQVGRSTEPELLAESAEVVLVLPAIGGHGVAHLGNNRVTFEAVLANTVPVLPEVMRLAWLLAQLQIDLPRYRERISRDKLDWLAMHAMLPPTIAAAREVELTPAESDLTLMALQSWHVGDSASQAKRAEILADWWRTYEENPPSWPVALAALDALLPPAAIAVDDTPSAADDPA